MFETKLESNRSTLWKVLPVAGGVFVLVVLALVYFGQPRRMAAEELTGVLHEGDPDYDWYRKYVELRNPKIEMGRNFAGNRIVMLSGIIENNGEKTLDVVEIKLVFFNYNEPVHEMIRVPIRPGPYTPPVEPLTERGFTLYVEEIPQAWQASHAEMSIHGFRFRETRGRPGAAALADLPSDCSLPFGL